MKLLSIVLLAYSILSFAQNDWWEYGRTRHFDAPEKLPNVCKLISSNYQEVYLYLNKNDKPILGKIFKISLGKLNYCSASLNSKSEVLTAAHCSQGNIEQTRRIGLSSVPILKNIGTKTKPKYVMKEGCTEENWEKNSVCHYRQRVQLNTALNQVIAECPTSDGDVEVRNLAHNSVWPNPLFSAKRPTYDMSIWKVKKPFVKTKPFKKIFNQNTLVTFLREYGSRCRTYGYGRNHDGSFGILKMRYTPVTKVGDTIISSRGSSVNPGDSGGALVCFDDKNEPIQIGVVSNAHAERDSSIGFNRAIEVYEFTSIAFHADWIKSVRTFSFAHKTENDWHRIVSTYERGVADKEHNLAYSCFKKARKVLPRYDRQNLKKQWGIVLKTRELAIDDYKKYFRTEPAFYRGHVKKWYLTSQSFNYICKQSTRWIR